MEELMIEDIKERLTAFAHDIYPIPDYLNIHEEYLNDLTMEEFITAFKEYRNIIVNFYLSAANRPLAFGYTHIDKKTGEEKVLDNFKSPFTFRDKLAQIQHFIIRICQSSILENDSLLVNVFNLIESINNLPKIMKPDLLIDYLIDSGFIFKGFNKNLKSSNVLTITYSKNKNVIKVIKSYSESKYARINMEFDYAHLNSKLLESGKNDNLKLEDLFIYHKLNDRAKEFLNYFNKAMNDLGYFYGDGPSAGFCWGSSQFAYSKAPEKKKDFVCRLYHRGEDLVVRLYLKKIDNYHTYIENSPGYIKEPFINDIGMCTHCKETCKSRKTYTIDHQLYHKCDGVVFEFINLELDAIPYYLQLIKYSNNHTEGKRLT